MLRQPHRLPLAENGRRIVPFKGYPPQPAPMTQPASGTLKKTPLHARHRSLGARMVEFGGWDMPVEYTGIADEHMAVRTRGGLFDVSHMGEIEIAGKDALAAVQQLTSNDASKLSKGQAPSSALPPPAGTFVDDVLTYKLAG